MAIRAEFAENGFLGPLPLLTRAQCRLLLNHVQMGPKPEPLTWFKGHAATDRMFYDVATDPVVVRLLRALLGDDIVLWGMVVIERDSEQIHPWHSDIESSAPEGGFVSIWIGLENVCRDSALKLVTRSHRLGKTLQQWQWELGLRRGEASDETILGWARQRDRHAELIQPDMTDGDAIVFDGRLWHASNNGSVARRSALLVQYGKASAPVALPDLTTTEWPFRFFTDCRCPVVPVSGRGDEAVNWVVPPPKLCADGTPTVGTTVQPISLPLQLGAGEKFLPIPLFGGPTGVLERMESHFSVLAPGHSPHPPHVHDEEELLICLAGEAELVISDSPATEHARIERLRPGDFVYYPAYQHHTIRNPTDANITYVMFKWQAQPWAIVDPLPTSVVRVGGDAAASPGEQPMRATMLIEHPTAYLGKLHMHTTELQPGAGYEPHIDDYDVAIVMLEGKVETVGCVVEPFGVIYYAAGEPHGMRNVGNQPARYLVFEFHASERQLAAESAPHDAEPPDAPAAPDRLSQLFTRAWGAFNEWFWSDRRPRTHIIEYSRLFWRKLCEWWNRPAR